MTDRPLMYKLNASAFYNASAILRNTIHLATQPGFPSDNEMTKENRDSSINTMRKLLGHADTLGVAVTKMAIEELIGQLSAHGITYRTYARLADNVDGTLRRELTLKTVLVLDTARQQYFDAAEPLFGREVATKFPGLAYEIAEAGNCYATDRTTASAFHSIRCLEAGIRAMSRSLSIPDPTKAADRSWYNILKTVKAEIDRRWPGASSRMGGDGRFFDEVHGALAAIQNPYRNSTMHLDATYTAPEALHIFEIVKGLMVTISSRMDDNGQPLA